MEKFNRFKSAAMRATHLGPLYQSFKGTAVGKRYVAWKRDRYQTHTVSRNRLLLAQYGEVVSAQFYAALKDAGYESFIAFGSLLGLVRDGHFIEHDDDLDFCIMWKQEYNWDHIDAILLASGFRVTRQFMFDGTITEHAYRMNDLQVDLFALRKEADQCVYYLYRQDSDGLYRTTSSRTVYEGRIRSVESIQEADFGFGSLGVPINSTAFLEDVYGADWRTPIAGFDSYAGPAMTRLGDFGERTY